MSQPPFNSFSMFGAMRSGSNLLEKYLNQYDGLVCHGELFHRFFIGQQGCQSYLGIDRDKRDENPQLLLDAVRAADPDKITGFRIFQTHNPDVIDAALKDPYCAKIILRRAPLDSFVSLQIALKTNQWLISDPAHRRAEHIRFDPEVYAIYLRERAAFYEQIEEALALTEQPFFDIDYDSLNDVATINRLAAFIGDKRGKATLDQPIKRQNPGPLSAKIENYDEVRSLPELEGLLDKKPPVLAPIRETGTDLSRIYFCENQAIAFAPVPAVPDFGVRQWLEAQDKRPPKNELTAHQFAEWTNIHAQPFFFSVVRHPVARAYNAFMQKVFATTSGGYFDIRQALEDQFGLMLPAGEISPVHPRATLEKGGYGVAEHRISFKLFLIFVGANLRNETKIRQDGKWQSQFEIIRRYRVIHPAVQVFRFEDLNASLAYIDNLLNLALVAGWHAETDPAYSFNLLDIYDAEIEALAQAAYERDYTAFDYQTLSGL